MYYKKVKKNKSKMPQNVFSDDYPHLHRET